MDADGTQIKADKFAFGRMWDRSAHPSNPWRLRRRKKSFSSALAGWIQTPLPVYRNGVC